jgi:hypothetical protein
MFNTTGPIGLENEPSVEIAGRRYSVAGSWDVNKRTGGGAEHTGPDTPLMRRVHGPGHLGPVFWLARKHVPQGFEHFGYPTMVDSSALDTQTRQDAAAYLRALVDAEPLSDWGKPNERVMYELPSAKSRLILMLRSGGGLPGEPPVGSNMLASTCELPRVMTEDGVASPLLQTEQYHACRPGTGIFNVGLPADRMPSKSLVPGGRETLSTVAAEGGPWPGYRPIPVGKHCNWSAPVVTNIPDSHSRACTAPLPDGRIFMIGAQIPHGRDPIVLSISSDGLNFSRAWAVRHCPTADKTCKPRFGGPAGFQYPSAAWTLVGKRGPEIMFSYSINKEDIGLTRFPLSVLD